MIPRKNVYLKRHVGGEWLVPHLKIVARNGLQDSNGGKLSHLTQQFVNG